MVRVPAWRDKSRKLHLQADDKEPKELCNDIKQYSNRFCFVSLSQLSIRLHFTREIIAINRDTIFENTKQRRWLTILPRHFIEQAIKSGNQLNRRKINRWGRIRLGHVFYSLSRLNI